GASEWGIGDPRRGAARLDDHRRDVSTRRELDLQLSQAGRIEELVREAGAVRLPAAAGGCGPEREVAIAVGPKHAELVVGARRRGAEPRGARGRCHQPFGPPGLPGCRTREPLHPAWRPWAPSLP